MCVNIKTGNTMDGLSANLIFRENIFSEKL